MTELQIISRVLNQKSMSILTLNSITEEHFAEYLDEYKWVKNHYDEYGNVPDKETFLSNFPDFDIIEVAESDKYLVDTLNEEYLYRLTVPILNKVGELITTDTHEAVQYLQSQLPTLLPKSYVAGVDIIKDAHTRYDEYKQLQEHTEDYLLPSGFKEIDEVIGGFHMGEELVVIFARTGQGKSWVLIKMLEHAWKMNKNIGMIEPEMTATKTGYRFDTLHGNISNSALNKGKELEDYESYIQELTTHEVPFVVAHPKDFRRKITVSKLRAFVESNNIDVLAVDGITYLTDERKQKGDSKTQQLTDISEDLMDLSIELGIPVLIVVQSNRSIIAGEDLELENIRDSDGISHNASLVLSVQQKDAGLQIAVKKNRNGETNRKFLYLWDADIGKFSYIPSSESGRDETESEEELRSRYNDRKERF